MLKDYKYSVISKTYITSFFRFLLISTSKVRMSEGTFCRVEVHIWMFKKKKKISVENTVVMSKVVLHVQIGSE